MSESSNGKFLPTNRILVYGISILLLLVSLTLFNKCQEEPEIIIREVVVEVPVVEHRFDTIKQPVPYFIEKVDTVYQTGGESVLNPLPGCLKRMYKETFEDSIQTINVYTETKGHIISQTVDYKTKPRYITVTDTIKVPRKPYFTVGVEVTYPVVPQINGRPAVKTGLGYTTKNRTTYTVSLDTDKRLWVGVRFKL